MKTAKRRYYEQRILEAGNNTRKKWEIVNTFLNRKARHDNVARILHNDKEYNDPLHIANAFSDFFFNHESTPTLPHNPCVNRLPHSFFLFPTTPHEILHAIGNQKVTSAGLDNVHANHIKMVAHLISDIFSFIVNLIFRTGVFPRELKRGKIIPVFKKGDRSLLPNYRPICILPFFSKVIEKLIEIRLTNYLNKFSILSPCQFGFRQGYSTELAIISLTDQIKKSIDEGCYAGSIFIDLTKAFTPLTTYSFHQT